MYQQPMSLYRWRASVAARKMRRALRMPPDVLTRRLYRETRLASERYLGPRRARRFTTRALLRAVQASSLEALWQRLGERPYPAVTVPVDPRTYASCCPHDTQRIMAAAARALSHRVDLLGSGPVDLGSRIDWHKDYKTGRRWEPAYVRAIDYTNLHQPSDVKFPWEVSRLQWLIPAGQAYLLTGDDMYAREVRAVLDDWITENPYARSVNWGVAMEAALRLVSWTWFFHVFHRSRAWDDARFRGRFLCALYLHGDFTERYIEHGQINGNHCTADAAGLVFAGLFFARGRLPARWQELGWRMLEEELPRQVSPDGTDFEAATAYHRLVLELFLLPALYREAAGLPVSESYRDRVAAMARFTAAYARPDGTSPLWGDADDGRALPFGRQVVGDHRYVMGLVGARWAIPDLVAASAGPRDEAFWLLGAAVAGSLPDRAATPAPVTSQSFPDGGFYIMRNEQDHVFIDCGPVGLADQGGHGHNDCLSFDAVLSNHHVVSDCGSYVYTASYTDRNLFRSTAYHNTPCVDGQEINRFLQPEDLWRLRYDAVPRVLRWDTSATRDMFQGTHGGYQRLGQRIAPTRTIVLSHASHTLVVRDVIAGVGDHTVDIPLHLAVDVTVVERAGRRLRLRSPGCDFVLAWDGPGEWMCHLGEGRISPRYGLAVRASRLSWCWRGALPVTLTLYVAPASTAVQEPWSLVPSMLGEGLVSCV